MYFLSNIYFLDNMYSHLRFQVSFILNLQSQSHCSLFDGTWQKRPRELDYRLRFEKTETALQIQ